MLAVGITIPVGVLVTLGICLLIGVGLAIDAAWKTGADTERMRQEAKNREIRDLQRADSVRIIAERRKWAEEKNNWPDFP